MLNSIIGTELTLSAFLICTAVSLVLGIGLALVSRFRAHATQSFAVTLAISAAGLLFYDRLCQRRKKDIPEAPSGDPEPPHEPHP